ncbi:MAG: beta-ketoacyl synthase N-terminal-like domain-containing protein [Stenotrophobium sp.]
MNRTRRPVYFIGGELVSMHGIGVDTASQACLHACAQPQPVMLPNLEADIALPYCPITDALTAYQRLHAVARTALARAQLTPEQRMRSGLFVGTSSGDIALHEQRYAAECDAGSDGIAIRHPFHGDMAEWLAREFGIDGPRYTLSTACSASANALLYAAWMIREGRIDHALVLGVEFQNRISLMGFNSMLLIARNGACRPFDVAREGIVLGEAVAATVLSATPAVSSRWQLSGGGSLCDASHPTNPAPEKIAETIRLALADAQFAASDIVAIKAHGTGTSSNDLGEGLGMRQVCGEPPPFTSIKPVLGHTLGACGVLETLVTQRCLEQGLLPATAGFRDADPALGIVPLTANHAVKPGPVLLNFFGFGGNNCSLVMAPC